MIRNYIIIAIRNLWRQKLYSILNILGLSIALAVSMIILNYVKTELSYDRHFPKADRIYRIINKTIGERGAWDWAPTAPLMAEKIREFVPEIEKLARFRQMNNVIIENRADSNNILKYENNPGFFVDSTVFEIFDIRVISGNKVTALTRPGSIVLTQSLAYKIFGDEDPVGRDLYIDGSDHPLSITAVINNFPETSHFRLSFLIDWQTFIYMIKMMNLEDLYNAHGWAGVYTYALLEKNAKAIDLKNKMLDFRKDFYSTFSNPEDITGEFFLQPITDIHLRSNLEQEIGPNGNIAYVIVFSLGAVFILIIAGVNYVNIASARAFKRMREIGIRKVTGAKRNQIINQFQGESVLTALLSGALSVLFIDLILPIYNEVTLKSITTGEIFIPLHILFFILLIILLGSLSGLYPSIFVSRFNPIEAVRGQKNPRSSANLLRQILVILQFTVSIFMIFSTIVIYRQMKYFNEKTLGFDGSQIINIRLNGELRTMAMKNPQMLKEELNKLPFISGTTLASNILGETFSVEGLQPDNKPEDFDSPAIRFFRVDEDFLNLLNIRLTEGENFGLPGGQESQFILNQRAVEILKLDHPIGTTAKSFFGQHGEIIGITEDFHFASLHHLIEPLVLEHNLDPDSRNLWLNYLCIKLSAGNMSVMLRNLEEHIDNIAPGTTFNYTFLDNQFDQLYKSEANFRDIFKAFSAFTIFISCLGIFGLSAYSVESRTKEIGIRKTNGAHIFGISILISKQFMSYVLIGLIISLPVGYFYINNWLQNFAYRIEVQIWDFFIAALIALIIALFSVSYQVIRAGLMNPARSLRYE